MSGYVAPCPSCGAEVRFALGASLLAVCAHCGSAIARHGAKLADYGKVAALLPSGSLLELGAEGRHPGRGAFRLVGRLQLDYGAGTWEEWLAAFADGSSAWLAESQGKFHLLAAAPLPPVPDHDALAVGQTLDLGPPGVFLVAEVRSARFASAAGELPFAVRPGTVLHYADLSGPKGRFATLDYGAGSVAETLYVGEEVAFADLHLTGLRSADERRVKTRGGALSCPQCGGPLSLRAPDETRRVACPYCGSLLDATRDLAVLEALASPPVKPAIPLGAAGELEGARWTVIGLLVRKTTIEGATYRWREYLLYGEERGFRWLTEYDGHWTFVRPLAPGEFAGATARRPVRFEGETYKHFQTCHAEVEHVLGEFYWAVARGDAVEASDYVCPPRILSEERDENEVSWSQGSYVAPEEIWRAFSLPGSPPARTGIASSQPSPYAGRAGATWREAMVYLALLVALFLALNLAGNHPVFNTSFALGPELAPGAPEAVQLTPTFEVRSGGNVQVEVTAAVDNSWLYLDGALVNDDTGEVAEFDLEVSYYHGQDSDGAWSEGGKTARRYVPSIRPGRYVLRLDPQWEAGKMPAGFSVTLRSRVIRFSQFLLVALLLLAYPLAVAWRAFRFEQRRWAESDHPWTEES